jgi:hypothetical protein
MTLCTSSCWNFSIEVEVYFGWSIPHEAPEGGFVKSNRVPWYLARSNCNMIGAA